MANVWQLSIAAGCCEQVLAGARSLEEEEQVESIPQLILITKVHTCSILVSVYADIVQIVTLGSLGVVHSAVLPCLSAPESHLQGKHSLKACATDRGDD